MLRKPVWGACPAAAAAAAAAAPAPGPAACPPAAALVASEGSAALQAGSPGSSLWEVVQAKQGGHNPTLCPSKQARSTLCL